MKDSYGREIDYFRISVTDRCNLRCRYCVSQDEECINGRDILSDEEILLICEAAAGIGIKNVRITGGEPLIRAGIPELIRKIGNIGGIERVSLTTNGILLEDYVRELADAGLYSVNVSLDTLNSERFGKITGVDILSNVGFREVTGVSPVSFPERIIRGIDAALAADIKVKINVVLTDINKDDWAGLAELAKNRNVYVRFIELMPIGKGRDISGVSNIELIKLMEHKYGKMNIFQGEKQLIGSGPAVYYHIPGFKGYIGFISAIHGKFCDSCNRIRLTSSGILKSCLCYDSRIDIHDLYMKKADINELENALKCAILEKPKAHCFEKPDMITERGSMIGIGG